MFFLSVTFPFNIGDPSGSIICGIITYHIQNSWKSIVTKEKVFYGPQVLVEEKKKTRGGFDTQLDQVHMELYNHQVPSELIHYFNYS